MEWSSPELAAVLDQLPDAVICTSVDGTLRWANDTAAELLGSSLADWEGRNVLEAVHPDDLATVINAFISIVDQDVGLPLHLRIVTADGTVHPIEARGRPLDVDGEPVVVNVLRRTDDRHALRLAGADTELLRMLVHHSPSILAFLDEDLRLRSASDAFTRLLGHDVLAVAGQHLTEFVSPAEREAVERALEHLEGQMHLSLVMVTATGATIHFDAHFRDLRRDPSVGGVVMTLADVTQLKLAEERLRELADLDPLTGALNRRSFLRTVQDALDAAASGGPSGTSADGAPGPVDATDIAVIYCDLDGFKPVNDRHGHRAGDQVLVEFVKRAKAVIRGSDLVGRIGGDEFAIGVIGDIAEGVSAIERRLRASIDAPFSCGGRPVSLGVSIGWADASEASGAEDILQVADERMYDDKRSKQERVG